MSRRWKAMCRLSGRSARRIRHRERFHGQRLETEAKKEWGRVAEEKVEVVRGRWPATSDQWNRISRSADSARNDGDRLSGPQDADLSPLEIQKQKDGRIWAGGV